jgi:hypothetical protein
MNKRAYGTRKGGGTAIIVALSFLSVLAIMTSAFVANLVSSSKFESSLEAGTKSFYIAEAGLNHAIWKLGKLGNGYRGESNVEFAEGRFDIIIEDSPSNTKSRIIFSRARLDDYLDNRGASQIRAVVSLQNSVDGSLEVVVEHWEKVY